MSSAIWLIQASWVIIVSTNTCSNPLAIPIIILKNYTWNLNFQDTRRKKHYEVQNKNRKISPCWVLPSIIFQKLQSSSILLRDGLLYISSQEAWLPQDINGSNCAVYTESTEYMQLCCLHSYIGCSNHKHEQTPLTTASHRLTVSVTISFTFSRKLWVGFP